MAFESIDALEGALQDADYLPDRGLSTALFLALRLEKPLLLEGEAGVGKTEVGRTLAAALETDLIRLQCYEGIDISTAVYEWDYPRQMLEIRLLEARGEGERAVARRVPISGMVTWKSLSSSSRNASNSSSARSTSSMSSTGAGPCERRACSSGRLSRNSGPKMSWAEAFTISPRASSRRISSIWRG